MPSSFVKHYTNPLRRRTPSLAPTSIILVQNDHRGPPKDTPKKQNLRAILISLEQDSSLKNIGGIIHSIEQENGWTTTISTDSNTAVSPGISSIDEEEETLERAVMTKMVVSLYSESLDIFLKQSIEVETEAQWWASIECSQGALYLYLLQTLPTRLLRLFNTIIDALKLHNLPVRMSQFTPSSLRALFPSAGLLRPSILLTSLFPHLRHNEQRISLQPSILLFSSPAHTARGVFDSIYNFVRSCWMTIRIPFELTLQECLHKRRELEKIRDRRARILGTLAQKRTEFSTALEKEDDDVQCRMFYNHLRPFATDLQHVIDQKGTIPPPSDISPLLSTVQHLLEISLNTTIKIHASEMQDLRRPSRLVLMWPKLVLYPPLLLFTIRTAYASRASLSEMVTESIKTIKGFVIGWLVEPIKDIINTVRANPEDGVIIQREAVVADIDSLERMCVSLAKDALHYGPEQLEELSRNVRNGNLTAVLKLYEEDIRAPIKSAITGTLLRSLFIQIQKTKVDIDQALKGIDKLLKSQELTFAFVGVAPALAIVYLTSGYLSSVLAGGRGRGRWGGSSERSRIMFIMRRIERLLISDSKSVEVSSLTAGLLLLSVASLRQYAETSLPSQSRVKEGFLEDIEDLEDPSLSGAEKRMVVERMWRSWGTVLGWASIAGENS